MTDHAQLTIAYALSMGSESLKQISNTARLDAEILLCYVLNANKTMLFTWPDKVLTTEQREQFNYLLTERQRGRPIAHLTGTRDFWTLTLKVNESTLIPRPDTETLIDTVLSKLATIPNQSRLSGVDLGTGTGAIALALSSELPDSCWKGIDYSVDAVKLAEQNKQLNGISNCEFTQSNWFDALVGQTFDLIVTNPPYIDPDDPHLQQGDVRFEPLTALIADEKGLADIKHIVKHAPTHLNLGGLLAIEHGYDQGTAIQHILSQNAFQKVQTIKDLGGNDRITIGYLL